MNMLNRFRIATYLLLCSTLPAWSATVSGTITFEGNAPKMRPINMDSDPICASKHTEPVLAEILVLGEGQTMANVLVRITEGLPKMSHPLPKQPVVLTQEGCRYSPHVFVVRAGQPLQVLNPDATLHNVHGFAKENPEFNTTMTKSVTKKTLQFEKAEAPFAFKCQIHPWMTAYCAVLDHPFYAVTQEDGQFEINDLPAGTYTLEAWHERLKVLTATITVENDGAIQQDFTFSR